MAKETIAQLQERLDVQKWVDSEAKGTDTCGAYDYCAFCDKNLSTPCAKAYNKLQKSQAPAAAKTEKKPAAKKPVAKKK